MNDLRYPIGQFTVDGPINEESRREAIDEIERLPDEIRAAVRNLTNEQLDTPYRPGGWTVRQVVHHIPDSHLNSYVRFKLALTEDEPTIKPYDEKRWAELEDGRSAPVDVSLALLESVHRRWVLSLRSIPPQDWRRRFRHPEMGALTLDKTVLMYAWHGRHHLAHITSLADRMGWRRPTVASRAPGAE